MDKTKRKIAIISCDGSKEMAERVVQRLKTADNIEVVFVGEKRMVFANQEIFARPLTSVSDSDCVFVFQCFTERVNDELMELFVLLDALRRSHAQRVFVVLPYFPYTRQDAVSEPRAPISAAMVARILEFLGMYSLITISLHARQEQGFFWGPVDNLSLRTIFADVFKKNVELSNSLVVAPDAGAGNEAKKFARLIGAEVVVLPKERTEPSVATILDMPIRVEGKTCIIYDDMLDTAGTVEAAAQFLRSKGAGKDLYLIATHPVLSGPAIPRLKSIGFKKVFFADTIAIPNAKLGLLASIVEIVSCAELITQVIVCRAEKRPLEETYKYEV